MASATGCTVKITVDAICNELVQNPVLGMEICTTLLATLIYLLFQVQNLRTSCIKRYGTIDYEWGILSVSTDLFLLSFLL